MIRKLDADGTPVPPVHKCEEGETDGEWDTTSPEAYMVRCAPKCTPTKQVTGQGVNEMRQFMFYAG
jgi:hypothetical protein